MKNKKEILKKILLVVFMAIAFFMAVKISFSYTQSKILDSSKGEIGTLNNLNNNNSDKNKIPATTIKGIKNILLLGADFREGEKTARTDSMMILTLDTVHKKVKVTSLLRDMLVNIEGYGKSKLNHAFAFGGAELTMQTIEDNFGVKIDDYVMIDFSGFMAIIDKLGGVEVDVQKEDMEDLNRYIFDVTTEGAIEIKSPGKQKLNGTQALAYCRIRKNSGGEQRRTERQREVINAIMQEVKDTNIFKYPSLVTTGLDYIETNMGFGKILDMAYAGAKLDLSQIHTLQVPFEDISKGGTWKNHGWVWRIDLDVTGELLRDYLFEDVPVDTSKVNKNRLNYNE